MSKYAEEKAKAREEAIEWQADFSNHDYSWSQLAFFSNHFRKLGKRYGLLREFAENGIA